MDANPLLLLAGYSIALVGASLLGGWLPGVVTMTHTRTQMVMSLVSGLILGVALYHLLPHGLAQIAGPNAVEIAVWWMMLGLILMLLLLRLFRFHQHDFSGEVRGHSPDVHSMSWIGIALGMALHTVTEGIALGASIRVEWGYDGGMGLAGLGVFLAIFLHKPLDALSITGVMQAAGSRPWPRTAVNTGFALLCPASALLAFWGVGLFGAWTGQAVGCTLAFSAGAFLCIALSDLLPEIHFHSHDRGKLTASFLIGIGLAYALRFVESDALHP